ncbi:hypothetical protein A616_16725 [Brevibacillus brevis X23]|nr:hypothetical protein A616_16725 [Brevibacillus brevis X23]
MGRKCVCKICNKKGTTDLYYCVADEKGKKKYYCSQDEYDAFMINKFSKETLFKYIALEVFQYEEGQIIPPVLIKKINTLNQFYNYEVIHECFITCKDDIQYWTKNKQFKNEYGMVSYVMRIIESRINDVFNKWKHRVKLETKQDSSSIDLLINGIDDVVTNKKDNTGILDFLDEEDM